MQGHVRQRGENSWELRVYVGRDATTKRARYKTRTFKGSKRDADRAMRAFLAEVDRGVISEGTFGELVERWFEVASTTRDWSPKGIAETRRIIDTRLGALARSRWTSSGRRSSTVTTRSCGRTVAPVGIGPVSRTTVTCARSGPRSRPPPSVAYTP